MPSVPSSFPAPPLASEAVIRAAAKVASALCDVGERRRLLYFVTPECNSLGSRPSGRKAPGGGRRCPGEGSGPDGPRRGERSVSPRRRVAGGPPPGLRPATSSSSITPDSATTARADVVLPAATFAEQSGTLVSLEGRAQRYYQRLCPPRGTSGRAGAGFVDIMRAAGTPGAPAWQNLDDVTAAMIDAIPALKMLRYVAPPADFRMTGQKIPRQPRRYSGRTAMTAHLDVREPKPPDDPDSPLAFSMEGFAGRPAAGPASPVLGAGLELGAVRQQVPERSRRSAQGR